MSSRRWIRLSMHGEGPRALASHTLVVYRGRLVVYGGTGSPFGLTTSKDVFVFNLDNQRWETLPIEASPELPPALYGQACLLRGSSFYTMGGTSGFQYQMQLHRLDLEERRWSRLSPDPDPLEFEPLLPPARYRHELCLHENRLLILGGGTALEAFGFEHIPAFNLETCQWESLVTRPHRGSPREFPEPRRCHSISHVGDGKREKDSPRSNRRKVNEMSFRYRCVCLRWFRRRHDLQPSMATTSSDQAMAFHRVHSAQSGLFS